MSNYSTWDGNQFYVLYVLPLFFICESVCVRVCVYMGTPYGPLHVTSIISKSLWMVHEVAWGLLKSRRGAAGDLFHAV